MDASQGKMMRAAIAMHVYDNIGFIQKQTSAFCDWARRYAEALRANIFHPPENLVTDPDKYAREMAEIEQAEKEYREGKRKYKPVWFPDALVGYMTLTAADCLFLKDERDRMAFRRPDIGLPNPLGVFGIPSCAALPARPLTEDEQLMVAGVISGQVYEEESFYGYCVGKPRAFAPASQWKDVFDLNHWRTHLGSRLAEPDGDVMIMAAWDRVKAHLPQLKPLPPGARLVYDELSSLEPHQAMTLPDIQRWYEAKTKKNLDEGTWKRWRPELEAYGMKNRPNVGYYIEQE